MTKVDKHIETKTTCDICGKDITCEEPVDYHIYDVVKNRGSITLNIETVEHLSDGLDACEECKAKAMFLGIIRAWDLDGFLYKFFKPIKGLDDGMSDFIKKSMKKFKMHGCNWIRVEWLKNKVRVPHSKGKKKE